MEPLLCERVNDFRHIFFHLLTCLITTTSKFFLELREQLKVTGSKIWTIGRLRNCLDAHLGQIVFDKDGVVEWCIVPVEMPLTRFCSYVLVCFQLVASVREDMLHKAMLIGHTLKLELTRVWVWMSVQLVMGLYRGHSSLFLRDPSLLYPSFVLDIWYVMHLSGFGFHLQLFFLCVCVCVWICVLRSFCVCVCVCV